MAIYLTTKFYLQRPVVSKEKKDNCVMS